MPSATRQALPRHCDQRPPQAKRTGGGDVPTRPFGLSGELRTMRARLAATVSRCRDDIGALSVTRPCLDRHSQEAMMNLEDRILRYTVRVDQNSYQPYLRSIKLALESGRTASIFFGQERPETFLEFTSTGTNLYMTTDQFTDVYHMI